MTTRGEVIAAAKEALLLGMKYEIEFQERFYAIAFEAGAASRDAEIAELVALLTRYRNETPLGHQPHMIAHLVDVAIAKVRKP